MKQRLGWAGVFLLPIVVLGGLWVTRRDPTQPNWSVRTQMAYSPAYRAQSANPVLPSGMTDQTPPAHTLPVDATPFRYAKTDADRARAGAELSNPVPDTSRTRADGERVYTTFCLPCHGASGNGDGPIIPKFPNPPSFHSEQAVSLRDGEMFHTITLGRNKMGSYASQLTYEERWEAVRHIRLMQKKGKG